ncbi:MAG: TetR/AcrR family transcriptional regulator [Planctomycetales bacterium]|nr:TetR/AcrR family transcriptional regulator [Planctomycetales bacterium]
MAEAKYHHGDLEQAIIETGRRMLERSGVAEVSLRAIARAIGVSHQAPYQHFASKADVLLAIRNAGFAKLAEEARRATAKHPRSPRLQLEEAAVSYVRLALESPAVYQLMFGGQIRPEQVADRDQSAATDAFAALAAIFQPAGELLTEATRLRTRLVWSMLHGIASLRINGFLADQPEGLVDLTRSACRLFSQKQP